MSSINDVLPHLKKFVRFGIHGAVTVGVSLGVLGGIKTAPSNSTSEQNTGHTYTHIGTLLFLGAYLGLSAFTFLLWAQKDRMAENQRKVRFSRVLTIVKFLTYPLLTARCSG